jgi:hypothetical protein
LDAAADLSRRMKGEVFSLNRQGVK